VADVLGLTVRLPEVKESTALGAAIYAGIGSGAYASLDDAIAQLVRFERSVEPNPAAREAYDAHFARWSELYGRMLDLSEAGLLRPMWWPAGANATEPS
jgi:autoinducer 2 (AI-2) kinase